VQFRICTSQASNAAVRDIGIDVAAIQRSQSIAPRENLLNRPAPRVDAAATFRRPMIHNARKIDEGIASRLNPALAQLNAWIGTNRVIAPEV
jgi:hypothetical protein